MTDHKLPLLYVFDRKPEIEREEGFLLAGLLAIDPIITEVVKATDEGRSNQEDEACFEQLSRLPDTEMLLVRLAMKLLCGSAFQITSDNPDRIERAKALASEIGATWQDVIMSVPMPRHTSVLFLPPVMQ